ncbi:DUF3431 domain-containing protein, partial [bacterium]|nr:DUF3431 domain-containing protein [Candidatus Elulimicrobium humile]
VGAFVHRIRDISIGKLTDLKDYEGLNELRVDRGWNTIYDFDDKSHVGLPLKEWWFKIYHKPPKENKIHCNYCALFLVSKKNLLFHSKQFYEELEKIVLEDEKIAGYVLERFWTNIFDGTTKGLHD